VLCLAYGLAAWLLTAVLPYRGETRSSGGPYVVALCVGGAVAGFVLGGRAAATGALLGAPGFVLLWWTAPRGDEDGLWLLWAPVVVFAALLAGLSHRAAGAVRARRG
jgi:hypothetical protein